MAGVTIKVGYWLFVALAVLGLILAFLGGFNVIDFTAGLASGLVLLVIGVIGAWVLRRRGKKSYDIGAFTEISP